MISEEASISNETKPSAQIVRGISRRRETRAFILSFCTKSAYRRRDKTNNNNFRFWHETDMPTPLRNVRSQEQSGNHMLALSFSDFDLGCVKTCAHENRAQWFSLFSYPDNRRQRFCFSN